MYMLLEREGEGCYLSAVVFIIVYNQARKCSNLIYKNTDIDTKKKTSIAQCYFEMLRFVNYDVHIVAHFSLTRECLPSSYIKRQLQ